MRIIVTGGSGFIGKAVVKALQKKKHYLKSIDSHNSISKSGADESADCDILSLERLKKEFKGFDSVIHLAGLPVVKNGEKEREKYFDVNVKGTENVLEASLHAGVAKVIFASSSQVYGNAKAPQKETAPISPINIYAETKAEAEKQCSVYSNRGLETVSLRLFNVYGPGQKSTAGVIPSFIKAIAEDSSPVVFGSGTQKRDFVYVGDVADAFALAAEKSCTSPAINIGSGKSTSIIELLKLMEEVSGKKISPEMNSSPAEIQETCADISLAKKILNWSPKTDLRNGLKKTFESFSSSNPSN